MIAIGVCANHSLSKFTSQTDIGWTVIENQDVLDSRFLLAVYIHNITEHQNQYFQVLQKTLIL